MIKYSSTKTKDGANVLGLEVVQSGMDITVKAGSFKVEGADYSLGEDHVFTATERPERVDAIAWLVQRKSDDVVLVVVDELVFDDNAGWPDHYDWTDSPYRKLKRIWHSNLPSNTTSLDDVGIYANKVAEEGGE